MLKIQYILPSPNVEAAMPGLSENASESSKPKRIRLYLVASPADAQHTINHLHLHGCIDRDAWSREVHIPEGGLVIRPDAGDVLRYLQRFRRFG